MGLVNQVKYGARWRRTMATRCCSLFVLFIYCFVYLWNHAMGLFGMTDPNSFA